MAGLPHFISSKASVNKFEPIFLNQFEVMITPPPGVTVPAGNPGNGNILLEHVISIDGLAVDQNPGETTQKYKNAKRYYSGSKPQKTGVDITMNFEVNLDNNQSMYVFKVMRQWADLINNPLTGAMGLKKDYCGTIVVSVFDKSGVVFRKITLHNCFLRGNLTPMSLNYGSTELFKLKAEFSADYFDDVFI